VRMAMRIIWPLRWTAAGESRTAVLLVWVLFALDGLIEVADGEDAHVADDLCLDGASAGLEVNLV